MAASPTWNPRLPVAAAERSTFPSCALDETTDLADVSLSAARASSVVLPAGSSVSNVVLQDCDIAGLTARSSRVDRALMRRCRLRGVTWSAGLLQDVTIEDGSALETSVRFSMLRRVVFRHCTLVGFDFTETVFDRVIFDDCELRGARFDNATVRSLRLQGCDLRDVTGARSMSGASIHPDDLLSLGPSMALAIGLIVE